MAFHRKTPLLSSSISTSLVGGALRRISIFEFWAMGNWSTTMSLWATVCSVAASFFGVQTAKNRQRDFTQGKAAHFIVIGVVMTLLLVVGLVMIVRLVLRQAGV